ncbi:Rieske 2Fe-2S domain protein [Tepidimonas alkaliphilus]|uniref:Rieske 2Fe-2S domain protein n=1 Tax=Tepidimonas alkaliphilus TaxID=2588942 RepID=A0A554W506_9BURK|nr:Rieske (2Fe-2S) protein [Tepidimonas alkaliphilus]TSE18660.1 Rieske 2Fe-2S domain protein [Tepidimonas alkaliphilus]
MSATPDATGTEATASGWHPLCRSADLRAGAEAVPFEVRWRGHVCRAFAVRYRGGVYGYLNRCSHVGLELDWQPNRFFDLTGQWLVCAAHGALFDPASGRCVAGPGRGPLQAIEMREADGWVYWRSRYDLQPV